MVETKEWKITWFLLRYTAQKNNGDLFNRKGNVFGSSFYFYYPCSGNSMPQSMHPFWPLLARSDNSFI